MDRNIKNRRLFTILSLIVALVAVTFAYASLTHTLKIKAFNECINDECYYGTGYPIYWKIQFENLSKVSKTGTAVEHVAPRIMYPTRIGDYKVSLSAPGDSVSYAFDVVNEGKLDAMLSSIYMLHPTCIGNSKDCYNVLKNIEYKLTYEDGSIPKYGDVLYAKNSGDAKPNRKRMKLTLAYSSNIKQSEIPAHEVMVDNLDAIMFYVQKKVIYDK